MVGVGEKLSSQRGASNLSRKKLENNVLRCPWKTLKEQTVTTKQEPLKGKGRNVYACV